MSRYQRYLNRYVLNAALVMLPASGLAGCATTSMTSYFAAVDLDSKNPELTFFRVKVKGSSFLVRSSFQSGFYDAESLHQLFGEVKKPNSTPTGRAGTVQLTYNAQTRSWESVNAQDRYTLLYGANADAIAQQIQLFADSDEAGSQIASLLAGAAGGDALVAALAAEQKATESSSNAKELAKLLGTLSQSLSDPTKIDSATTLRKLLLQAAQAASDKAGSSVKFDPDPDKGFVQVQAVYELLSK